VSTSHRGPSAQSRLTYSDGKVANRDTKVWRDMKWNDGQIQNPSHDCRSCRYLTLSCVCAKSYITIRFFITLFHTEASERRAETHLAAGDGWQHLAAQAEVQHAAEVEALLRQPLPDPAQERHGRAPHRRHHRRPLPAAIVRSLRATQPPGRSVKPPRRTHHPRQLPHRFPGHALQL
jgi:hypothetical protein